MKMNLPNARRRGSVLLIVLFAMAFTAPLVLLMVDTYTSWTRCTHNYIESEKALYLAQAGVHDVMEELLTNNSWRLGFIKKEFPTGSGNTYSVKLEDEAEGRITVVSMGETAAGAIKTVTCTLTGF